MASDSAKLHSRDRAQGSPNRSATSSDLRHEPQPDEIPPVSRSSDIISTTTQRSTSHSDARAGAGYLVSSTPIRDGQQQPDDIKLEEISDDRIRNLTRQVYHRVSATKPSLTVRECKDALLRTAGLHVADAVDELLIGHNSSNVMHPATTTGSNNERRTSCQEEEYNKPKKQTSDTSLLSLAQESGAQQEETLYFAYGSNLSHTQMRQRCPRSEPVGLAHVSGFEWMINERGYANIVENSPPPFSAQSLANDDTPCASDPNGAGAVLSSISDSNEPITMGGAKASRGRSTGGGEMTADEVKTASCSDERRNQREDKAVADAKDMDEEKGRGPGVYGVVYRLDPSDGMMLDICEGAPYIYARETVDGVWIDDFRHGAPESVPYKSETWTPDKEVQRDALISTISTSAKPCETAKRQYEERGEKSKNKVCLMAYIDRRNITPGLPRDEYIGRINRGISEASAFYSLPDSYIETVIRRFIPNDE